jgi:hypothetical protein
MTGGRDRLAAQQSELLSALLGQSADPPGFEPEQLRVQRWSLLAKRRRVVARLRPDLPEQLGDRFSSLFDAYAAERPRRTGGSARDDAAEFARWLSRHGVLRRRWRRG